MTIDDALPTWHWRSAHAARVSAPPQRADAAARRRFGRYWRLVGPFSSITRREMLSAIRRRAEA